jgi:hypothetical protein
VWVQINFLLCMVWFGFEAVLRPLAALVAVHVGISSQQSLPFN